MFPLLVFNLTSGVTQMNKNSSALGARWERESMPTAPYPSLPTKLLWVLRGGPILQDRRTTLLLPFARYPNKTHGTKPLGLTCVCKTRPSLTLFSCLIQLLSAKLFSKLVTFLFPFYSSFLTKVSIKQPLQVQASRDLSHQVPVLSLVTVPSVTSGRLSSPCR